MEALTLQEAVRRFLDRHNNEETARSYRQTLSPFVDGYGRDRQLASFTDHDIDTWDEQLCGRGLATATVASHRRRMKIFWKWCVDRSYIGQSPARFLRVRKRRASMASKAMPNHVIKAMLQAVRQKREALAAIRDTAILGLMVTYGARRGDVARLRLNAVNLRDRWIVLTTKGDNQLRLPLPPEITSHLHRWLELRQTLPASHEYVFTTIRPDRHKLYPPLTSESISTMIKRLSKQVSGIQYGPHAIRHWFGQHHADNRIPPTLLRDLMGHSDVKTTLDHYYNQDFDRMRTVLEQTEMAHDLGRDEPDSSRRKPKIVHVDFTRRTG